MFPDRRISMSNIRKEEEYHNAQREEKEEEADALNLSSEQNHSKKNRSYQLKAFI